MNTPGSDTERLRTPELPPILAAPRPPEVLTVPTPPRPPERAPTPTPPPPPELALAPKPPRPPELAPLPTPPRSPEILPVLESTRPPAIPPVFEPPRLSSSPQQEILPRTNQDLAPQSLATPEELTSSPSVRDRIIMRVRTTVESLVSKAKRALNVSKAPSPLANNQVLIEDLWRIISTLSDRKLTDEERSELERKMEEMIGENEGMRQYTERLILQNAQETSGAASREVLSLKKKRRRDFAMFAALLLAGIGVSSHPKESTEKIPSMNVPPDTLPADLPTNHPGTTPQLIVHREQASDHPVQTAVERPLSDGGTTRPLIPTVAALEVDLRQSGVLSAEEQQEMNQLMARVSDEQRLSEAEVERITRLMGRSMTALQERLELLIQQSMTEFERDALRSRAAVEEDVRQRRNQLQQLSRVRRGEMATRVRSLRTIVEAAINRSRKNQ